MIANREAVQKAIFWTAFLLDFTFPIKLVLLLYLRSVPEVRNDIFDKVFV